MGLACHDSVGWYAGDVESDGKTIIVALNLRYYDQVIHPMWVADEIEGVRGSAEVPAGTRTLGGLEAAILAQLGIPETSTEEATSMEGLVRCSFSWLRSAFFFRSAASRMSTVERLLVDLVEIERRRLQSTSRRMTLPTTYDGSD